MKNDIPYIGLILGLVAADQVSKAVVVKKIPFYGSVPVIPGFCNLSHIHNKGAIFGSFNNSDGPWPAILLRGLSLVALAMVVFYFLKTPASQKGTKLALALILAGALGNFVDRVTRGYVIDFIELYAGRFHWPTFNIADSCISIGALWLLAMLFLRRPHASHPD